MTCIVGLVDKGKVWIGGDSAGVGGYALTSRADLKVFTNGPFIMGFTSSFRMGQLLQYSLVVPAPPTNQRLMMQFMVTDFINAVRECFKTGGVAIKKDGEERCGQFLVGFKGRLFNIDDDYQVGESRSGYDAIGCGSDYALGSLFSTKKRIKRASERVFEALKAAENFSAGVSGPFHVIGSKVGD